MPRNLKQHFSQTLSLAVPVMLSRLGILLIITVDTVMTGHAGGNELAAYGLAAALHVPMILVGVGMLTGTLVISAQLDSRGCSRECATVWRVATMYALVLGIIGAALCHTGEWFMQIAGQPQTLSADAAQVLIAFGWGIPGMLAFVATTLFLESIRRPGPGLWIMIFANIANIILNWGFVHGNAYFPELGAQGAALATSIVRWGMFFALAAYAFITLDRRHYGLIRMRTPTVPADSHRAAPDAVAARPGKGQRAVEHDVSAGHIGKRLRQLGVPIALGYGFETCAFSSLTLFAGLAGAAHVAGFQVIMNLLSLVFMCAVGLATAASVRVSNAFGRADYPGLRPAGWVAVGCVVMITLTIAAVFALVPHTLAALYTHDTAVLAIAAPAVALAALAMLPDTAQAVFAGALRGLQDVWSTSLILLCSFWFVMVPLGFYLGVQLGLGTSGLIWAIFAGCTVATFGLGSRFHILCTRHEAHNAA